MGKDVHRYENVFAGNVVTKKADPYADTSILERNLDEMVYKLYDLTEEEIAIVEGNTHG